MDASSTFSNEDKQVKKKVPVQGPTKRLRSKQILKFKGKNVLLKFQSAVAV